MGSSGGLGLENRTDSCSLAWLPLPGWKVLFAARREIEESGVKNKERDRDIIYSVR